MISSFLRGKPTENRSDILANHNYGAHALISGHDRYQDTFIQIDVFVEAYDTVWMGRGRKAGRFIYFGFYLACFTYGYYLLYEFAMTVQDRKVPYVYLRGALLACLPVWRTMSTSWSRSSPASHCLRNQESDALLQIEIISDDQVEGLGPFALKGLLDESVTTQWQLRCNANVG